MKPTIREGLAKALAEAEKRLESWPAWKQKAVGYTPKNKHK